jgi:hypothetical protein
VGWVRYQDGGLSDSHNHCRNMAQSLSRLRENTTPEKMVMVNTRNPKTKKTRQKLQQN